jgi:acetyl esterase/lipase
LPLGIAGPELAPLLAVAAVIVGIVAFRSQSNVRFLAAALLAATIALGLLPTIQWPATRTRFDAATRELPPVQPPNPPIGEVSITRGIVFAEPDGMGLTLDVYRPVSPDPLPVVVQVYGGAWRSGGPGDDARFAAEIARQGYVVIAIDYRHVPAAQWPAQIDDVRTAIDWVIAHARDYGGNPQHIALIGRSSGAQLALVAAFTDARRIAAVISFYGPTNLAAGWQEPPSPDPLPVRPVLEAFLGGTPAQVPKLYDAASPLSYVSKGAPPTLLIYGARDHIVEARFGRELDTKLKAVGVSSIYLEIPWAEHAFDKVPGLSVRLTQPYVERFLAAYLH